MPLFVLVIAKPFLDHVTLATSVPIASIGQYWKRDFYLVIRSLQVLLEGNFNISLWNPIPSFASPRTTTRVCSHGSIALNP